MNKPKFTPGPWNTEGEVIYAEGKRIAEAAPGKKFEGTPDGNLIASAPDLYAALVWIYTNTQHTESRERAAAALARARGEGQ